MINFQVCKSRSKSKSESRSRSESKSRSKSRSRSRSKLGLGGFFLYTAILLTSCFMWSGALDVQL